MNIRTLYMRLPSGAVSQLLAIDLALAPAAIDDILSTIDGFRNDLFRKGEFKPGLAMKVRFGVVEMVVSLDAELFTHDDTIDLVPATSTKRVAPALTLASH